MRWRRVSSYSFKFSQILLIVYHPSPSPLFKDGPIRGKNVATTLRRKTPAASAEAA